MIRLSILAILLAFSFSPFSLSAAEGYIGENPGLNFYSRIDENSNTIANGLIKKRLSEYSTFTQFGRYCRSPSSWFDSERMDRKILDEIWLGNYASIVSIAQRKRVTLSTENLTNIVDCLRDAYSKIQVSAIGQYESISTMGSMGLYMDGDTSNSDYDVITDIEKINSLIFSEELKYDGTKNGGKVSLNNLLSGKPVLPLISSGARTELDTILGNTGSSSSGNTVGAGNTTSLGTTNGSISLGNLGIGDTCSTASQTVSVANMADDTFLTELDAALRGNGAGVTGISGGGTYSQRDRLGSSGSTGSGLATSKADFFHTARCESVFCIKVKMVSGSNNLLSGGRNTSIEGILDKHIGLLEPISWTDLGLQKMTNNMIQVPYTGLSLKFKAKVKGGGMFIGQKPTPKDRYKGEDTKESKNAKFEQARRCSLYSAGFSTANPKIANSIMGAGYVTRMGETTENKFNTALPIAPTNPEDTLALRNCMSLAQESGRKVYYESVGDDLSEIQTFTSTVITEVAEILATGEKIDTLRVE